MWCHGAALHCCSRYYWRFCWPLNDLWKTAYFLVALWRTRTHMNTVCDLYHHSQHFYSTILSHTANCCGRDKLIWTVSCISHKISHLPCCKLAQVVAFSSPPFNVKLSVWLPSSCNAAQLIAKATTQLKEVAFCHPTTRYHILWCYTVCNPG